MERISIMRAALLHGDYERDMQELRDGNWNGSEVDYQKVLHHRLVSTYVILNHIVTQVDPHTGKFRRTWVPGRSLCASCKAQTLPTPGS